MRGILNPRPCGDDRPGECADHPRPRGDGRPENVRTTPGPVGTAAPENVRTTPGHVGTAAPGRPARPEFCARSRQHNDPNLRKLLKSVFTLMENSPSGVNECNRDFSTTLA